MLRTITITRYDDPVAITYAGHIEGVSDDGQSWIIYLDALGRPESYWAWREPDGAVIGDPVPLLGPGVPLTSPEQRAQICPPLSDT